MTDWPKRCNDLLSDCSILDVIAIQLADYEHLYGEKPEIIILARQMKGPLVREVFQRHQVPPEVTVIEPIWIGCLPLVCKPLGEAYLKLVNNRTGKELVL